MKPNPASPPASNRGHIVVMLGRKLGYCKQCKMDRPPGGYVTECAKLAQPRQWMGGE